MTPLREFKTVREMLNFYQELDARMRALHPPPAPPPPPQPVPPAWPPVGMTPIQRIILAVSREFNQPPNVIRSRSNLQEAVVPRQVIALLAKELTSMSTNAIGVVLGNRDHSTIMHSTSAIAGKIASNPVLALKVERLRHKLLEKNDEHVTGRREQDSERAGDYG